MIEWHDVEGGRARSVSLRDDSTTWVLVSGTDGHAQFYAGARGVGDLASASATGGLPDVMDQLYALDFIDIVCRCYGNEDPGPIADV